MKKLCLILLIFLGCAYLQPKILKQYEAEFANEKAVVLFEKGQDYFNKKSYAQALKQFQPIIEKYKKSDAFEPALYLTAFCYYKLNLFEKAVSTGEYFVKQFPNSKYYTNTLSLLGESYYNLAQDYQASFYLLKFYTTTKDTSARTKAFDHILKTLPELSISQLEKLHRTFMAEPVDEHILYHLAQLEAREGKKAEAERDFNLLLRRYPRTTYKFEVEEYKRFINLGATTGRAGVLLPLSGKFAEIGKELFAVVKAFEKEKLLPFSLHILDTKSDPIEAIIAAQKLINELQVDFLIAPVSSREAFGICGFADGKGVPTFLPITEEARFEQIPLIFTRKENRETQAKIIADYSIFDLGIKKFAILYTDDENYRDIADAFAQEVIKNNRTVVANISFSADSITLKYQIMAIKKMEPEAIFLAMSSDMIINTSPQIAYYGLEDIQLLGIKTFKSEKVPRLGERYVEGAVFSTPAEPDSSLLKIIDNEIGSTTELAKRFFEGLSLLKGLKDYTRTTLPRQIDEITKENQAFDIYKIINGDFQKIARRSEK
ncbi:hypothetical protein BXT86_01245 [candidate division WOR-3 bacterium 4484_100]|uniref:Leucine-binding protein domain-containing protein n=1 Tax=candidate division WOR-3 bacterium 4484_100 TaxID=1936077 RepID=A0A1V4QGT2_UNCW3|nr:MAG: hypothetical protein BXT86_01245 [candidate division WOR-3 bacterium 4484_100]